MKDRAEPEILRVSLGWKNEENHEGEGRDAKMREKEIGTYKRMRKPAELGTGHKGVCV